MKVQAEQLSVSRVALGILCVLAFVPGVRVSAQVQTASSAGSATTDRIQPIALAVQKPAASERKQHGSYKVEIDPGSDWTDTKIAVVAGDVLTLSTEGTLRFADGRSISAAGAARGWKDLLRSFPLDTANVGAVIGRIGDNAASVPFVIGEHSEFAAPQSGDLFVRTNLSSDLQPSGKLALHVKLAAHPASASPESSRNAVPALALAVLDQSPRRVTDEQGTPGDVVNFALIGSEQQVEDAFTRSGWITVDANVDDALLHGVLATLEHKAYVTMPMSKLYLFGRPQDHSYARAEALKVAAYRHHLRLWNTGETVGGQPLWIGSATYDNGLERDQRNGNVTHSIDPEIDTERRFLLDSFVNSGSVSSAAYAMPQHPVKEGHTATGGSFRTDGRVVVMALN